MATIKFVSVSTSPQLSLALLLSAAPHSHILLGLTEHFIKMVSSYRHTGDPSDLVLFSILGGIHIIVVKLCVSGYSLFFTKIVNPLNYFACRIASDKAHSSKQ